MKRLLGPWLPPLTRARIAAEQHMAVFERVDDEWKEETITELILAGGWPELRWATFTRNEEAETGADWMWWWVDRSGACFGMLIQAKRVRWSRAGTPSIDFMYDHGKQRQALQRSARRLQVPAVYALYLGTPDPVRERYCPEFPHPGPGARCDRCHRATVSLYASPLVTVGARTKARRSDRALKLAYPLEDAARLTPMPWSTHGSFTGSTNAPQSARTVAERLMAHITVGLAVSSAPQAPPATDTIPDAVGWVRASDLFPGEEPAVAEGHDDAFFGITEGLHTQLPEWVQRATDRPTDDQPDVPENLAGIVIVQLPD